MAHTRLLCLGAVSLLTLAVAVTAPRTAEAVWPPPADATPADMAMPTNWPNDPNYGTQWEDWSWVPQANLAIPGFRTVEIPLGAGNNVDRAWGLSVGDPRVLLAVVDCGIEWDNTEIQNKVALNTGELPLPMGASTYDANGDGVVNVQDYANDPRVRCGVGATRDPRHCMGADGHPNDPNVNGILDGEDLILAFSDHTDGDHNGYVDDIAGWDFFHDDNDPADDTRYGHGTGEMRWSAAETNNGEGGAGTCPRCMVVPVRAGDSFIAEVNDFAQGTVYAVDRGARIIQEALGTLDNSTYAGQAIDYAYAHDVLVVASAADENSRHHNVPGTANHTLVVHAIRYDTNGLSGATTFLNFNNCTNYGAQLALSVAGTGCSSEATGQTSGMAGLLYSEALQTALSPTLSPEEARQLFVQTADDINVPESVPGSPAYDPTKYPSYPGWDERFGYGRTNARRALEWVRDRRIPPEVDLVSPRWFTVLNPSRATDRTLTLTGRIAARRATDFDYTVEWTRGIETAGATWLPLRTVTHATAPVTGTLATLDLTGITVDNPGDVQNRYSITVRIRATAHYGGTLGDVPGETRRAFEVRTDPTVLPGFPIAVGGSGESSPHLADLDGDGVREIVYATADGEVHAIRGNGTELAGWPVHTNLELGADPTRTPSYVGSAGYAGDHPAIDPTRLHEAVLASPGIADLDGDGQPEVVACSFKGTVYVWHRDGTPYGHGFPYVLPDVPSSATSPAAILARGIFGSPVLTDLNGDHRPEIVFGAFDGQLYALDTLTAAPIHGFPVDIHSAEPNTPRNRVFGGVGVGDFNGDHQPELAVVSNEQLGGDSSTGAIYTVWADGNLHAGGPFLPNWPIAFTSFHLFPMVGEGISTSPAIADIDGDGRDELTLTGSGVPTTVLAHGVQPAHGARPSFTELSAQAIIRTSERGQLSTSQSDIISFANVFSLGSFGDMNGDGHPDFVTSGAELDLAINLSGGGRRRPFEHLLSAWNGLDGHVLPGFPQVIEDYTFFMNPSIADVNRDGFPEAIVGTGGYYLHAFDGCGREPTGWPKFTGQWIIPSPAVGDVDGDHVLEVVSGTRGGYLWAWHADGDDRTASIQWEGFRHDNANTGNWGTALAQGVRSVPDGGVLQCPLPTDDAGVLDAGVDVVTVTDAPAMDAGMDAGARPTTPVAGGCGCTVPRGNGTAGEVIPWGLALALGMSVRRRRRS